MVAGCEGAVQMAFFKQSVAERPLNVNTAAAPPYRL